MANRKATQVKGSSTEQKKQYDSLMLTNLADNVVRSHSGLEDNIRVLLQYPLAFPPMTNTFAAVQNTLRDLLSRYSKDEYLKNAANQFVMNYLIHAVELEAENNVYTITDMNIPLHIDAIGRERKPNLSITVQAELESGSFSESRNINVVVSGCIENAVGLFQYVNDSNVTIVTSQRSDSLGANSKNTNYTLKSAGDNVLNGSSNCRFKCEDVGINFGYRSSELTGVLHRASNGFLGAAKFANVFVDYVSMDAKYTPPRASFIATNDTDSFFTMLKSFEHRTEKLNTILVLADSTRLLPEANIFLNTGRDYIELVKADVLPEAIAETVLKKHGLSDTVHKII